VCAGGGRGEQGDLEEEFTPWKSARGPAWLCVAVGCGHGEPGGEQDGWGPEWRARVGRVFRGLCAGGERVMPGCLGSGSCRGARLSKPEGAAAVSCSRMKEGK